MVSHEKDPVGYISHDLPFFVQLQMSNKVGSCSASVCNFLPACFASCYPLFVNTASSLYKHLPPNLKALCCGGEDGQSTARWSDSLWHSSTKGALTTNGSKAGTLGCPDWCHPIRTVKTLYSQVGKTTISLTVSPTQVETKKRYQDPKLTHLVSQV